MLVHFYFITFSWYFWMSCSLSLFATRNVTDIVFPFLELKQWHQWHFKWQEKWKIFERKNFHIFLYLSCNPGLRYWDRYQCMTSSGRWNKPIDLCYQGKIPKLMPPHVPSTRENYYCLKPGDYIRQSYSLYIHGKYFQTDSQSVFLFLRDLLCFHHKVLFPLKKLLETFISIH